MSMHDDLSAKWWEIDDTLYDFLARIDRAHHCDLQGDLGSIAWNANRDDLMVAFKKLMTNLGLNIIETGPNDWIGTFSNKCERIGSTVELIYVGSMLESTAAHPSLFHICYERNWN